MEKGYLFILVNLPKRVEELNVANVPQKALPSSCTSVDDVQGNNAGNTKTSNNAGDDTTNEDSLCHDLTSFHENKMPQRREPLARLL